MSRTSSDAHSRCIGNEVQEDEMLTSTTDSMTAEIAYRQTKVAEDYRRANGRRASHETVAPKHASGRRWLLRLRHAA